MGPPAQAFTALCPATRTPADSGPICRIRHPSTVTEVCERAV